MGHQVALRQIPAQSRRDRKSHGGFRGFNGGGRHFSGSGGGIGAAMGGMGLSGRGMGGAFNALGLYPDPHLNAAFTPNLGLGGLGTVPRNPMAAMYPATSSRFSSLNPMVMSGGGVGYQNLPPRRGGTNSMQLGSPYGNFGMGMGMGVGMGADPHLLASYPGHGCRSGPSCSCEHESSIPHATNVKTKDILIRGKTYQVRKSFLAEAGKFESEVAKYMEKKTEETVPTHVVHMLVDFINEEACQARTLLDFVTLHILASNLGVKSAQEHVLAELKGLESEDVGAAEVTNICAAVLLSSKVDEKLREWLRKFLKYGDRYVRLRQSDFYLTVHDDKPELDNDLLKLLGLKAKTDVPELRVL